MLQFLWFVVELLERLSNVARYRKMYLSPLVITVKRDANVLPAVPFYCDGIVIFERALEILSMLFTNILETKIAHHYRELYRLSVMFPKTCDQFALAVASLVEPLFRGLVG